MSGETKKPGIFERLSRSLRDTRGEMKKVVWPTKEQTVNNTGIVLVFMAIMAVIISLFDIGVAAVLRLFFGGAA